MRLTVSLAFVLTAACALPVGAKVVLFDATLGTPPSAQGWPFISDPLFGHSVTETVGPGFTTLDSLMPITDRGGYFSRDPIFGALVHPDMPVIDRHTGFSIRFDVRIASENHTVGPAGDDNGDGLADRAGFSVTAISEDLEGLELGFWQDRIWTQDDDAVVATQLFTQAEGVAHDTTAAIATYQLQMFGDRYRLLLNGALAPLLTGRLRNYTNFTGPIDPYETPSFLFLGDNTTRGEVQVELAHIAVEPLPTACAQADALVGAIAAQTHQPSFDLTGDGQVDAADMAQWLVVAGEFYLGAGQSFLAGDANLDGAVNGQDFIVWNTHKFTATPSWCAGDFTTNGSVNGQDFVVWNNFKFLTSEPPTRMVGNIVHVPEPAAWWAGWIVAAAATLWRRR